MGVFPSTGQAWVTLLIPVRHNDTFVCAGLKHHAGVGMHGGKAFQTVDIHDISQRVACCEFLHNGKGQSQGQCQEDYQGVRALVVR